MTNLSLVHILLLIWWTAALSNNLTFLIFFSVFVQSLPTNSSLLFSLMCAIVSATILCSHINTISIYSDELSF